MTISTENQLEKEQMTLNEIEERLAEIDIEISSYEGDEEYDLAELYQEQEDLENAIANGDYSDCEEI